MAKPIAPTPVLKGQAAIEFIQELSQNKKASEEETIRINKGAERIKSMLTFSFWCNNMTEFLLQTLTNLHGAK